MVPRRAAQLVLQGYLTHKGYLTYKYRTYKQGYPTYKKTPTTLGPT